MITKLSISQMFGIDQLNAQLGDVVLIEGRNGSGKTSILAAVLQMIEGGHDPGVLRRYCAACNATAPEGDKCACGGDIATAEKAKVEITLDNGCRFLYTCTEKTYKLEGWNKTGAAIKAPKTSLESMISMDQVSPGELLKIDASTKPGMRDLRDRLQRLIPLQFFTGDMPSCANTSADSEAIGVMERALESVAKEARTSSLDLAGFDRAVSIVRETRTRINSQKSEKEKTVSALQGKVDQSPEDVGLRLDAARQVLGDEKTRWAKDLADTTAASAAAITAADAKMLQENMHVDAWVEKRIGEIREEAARQKAEVRQRNDEAVAAIRAKTEEILAQGRPEHERKLAEYSADVARLEQIQTAFIESEQTRRHRDEFQRDARDLARQSIRYDRAIELLEALRIEKLQNLPIPGLEVGADFVRVDGIDWEKLNTAKRMLLCIRICARLSTGEQKIIFLDHGEAFDSETFEEVTAACKGAGFQLLLARVTDAPKVRIAA